MQFTLSKIQQYTGGKMIIFRAVFLPQYIIIIAIVIIDNKKCIMYLLQNKHRCIP